MQPLFCRSVLCHCLVRICSVREEHQHCPRVLSHGARDWLLRYSLSWEISFRAADGKKQQTSKKGKQFDLVLL